MRTELWDRIGFGKRPRSGLWCRRRQSRLVFCPCLDGSVGGRDGRLV